MTISRRVTTESGTVYEFDDEQKLVRRVLQGDARDMRRDGEWLKLFITNVSIPGVRMTMFLEPLAEDKVRKPFTVRTTTPVTHLELVDHVEATLEPGEIVLDAPTIRRLGAKILDEMGTP